MLEIPWLIGWKSLSHHLSHHLIMTCSFHDGFPALQLHPAVASTARSRWAEPTENTVTLNARSPAWTRLGEWLPEPERKWDLNGIFHGNLHGTFHGLYMEYMIIYGLNGLSTPGDMEYMD